MHDKDHSDSAELPYKVIDISSSSESISSEDSYRTIDSLDDSNIASDDEVYDTDHSDADEFADEVKETTSSEHFDDFRDNGKFTYDDGMHDVDMVNFYDVDLDPILNPRITNNV